MTEAAARAAFGRKTLLFIPSVSFFHFGLFGPLSLLLSLPLPLPRSKNHWFHARASLFCWWGKVRVAGQREGVKIFPLSLSR